MYIFEIICTSIFSPLVPLLCATHALAITRNASSPTLLSLRPNARFQLVEDLQLIVGLYRTKEENIENFTGYGETFFLHLKQKYANHNRSPASLRDRFEKYLRILTKENILSNLD